MMKLSNGGNRREVLAGGAAAGLLTVTGLSAQPSDPSGAASSNLKISITLNGVLYSYPNGPAIPSYYVGFRNDGRVVFHLGALGDLSGRSATSKPYHLGPHRVKIENGTAVLFDKDIPAHWWNAEWAYRPTPIMVRNMPARLVAANRMFPFGDTGCKVGPQGKRTPYTVMGSSDITKGMPQTGERPDIGLTTDNGGFFMLGGDPLPMLDWAQANDSCPLHFRDETTGKPINLLKYPQANSADLPGLQGSPWLPKGPYSTKPGEEQYTGWGGDWGPQQAHFCEMSYIAYLATGDLGFLENLQYNANFTVLCDAYLSRPASGAVIHGEVRGIGWALRNLFMAHIATMDAEAAGTLPATCHPSSYFKKLLDQSLAYYDPLRLDPTKQTFRLIGDFTRSSSWMCDYVSTSLAFGVLTGHSDWAPLYLWTLGNVIARTNGTSGYPPGAGTPYRLNTVAGGQDATLPQFTWRQAFDSLVGDPEVTLTQADHDMLVAKPLNGGKSFFIGSDEYMMTTRAALVMADYLDKKGLATVRATYPDFDTSLKNAETMFLAYGKVNPRVSVVA